MTKIHKIEHSKVRKNKKIDTRMRARISHDAKVHVLLGSEVFKGSLRDISQQGLYFFSNDVQNIESQIDQAVFIEIFMEQGESVLAVETRGYVVRTDEGGCAINFSHTLLWWPVFSVFPVRIWEEEEQNYMHPNSYDQQIPVVDAAVSQ